MSLLGAIIMSSASPKLAAYWIPRMISGETLMGVCVIEPSWGADASALRLRCHCDGDVYVHGGEKTSITFADCADARVRRTARNTERIENARRRRDENTGARQTGG
jgi:cyclohexanecarboxyl-CoA dehydrogenase